MQVNHYGHTLNFLMRTTAKHIGVVHFVFAKSINIWNKNHSNWLYNCVTFRNGAPFTDAKTSSTKNYMAVPNWVHPTTTTPTKTAEIDIFFSQIEIDLTTPITLPINSQIHTHSECMLHANSHFLFFAMCSKSQSQAVCVCNSQIEKITIHSIYLAIHCIENGEERRLQCDIIWLRQFTSIRFLCHAKEIVCPINRQIQRIPKLASISHKTKMY